jgi:hypothetical protein
MPGLQDDSEGAGARDCRGRGASGHPAALISAVAAYLGVGAVVAGAFIASVIGDTADIIAEKLCRKIGLC